MPVGSPLLSRSISLVPPRCRDDSSARTHDVPGATLAFAAVAALLGSLFVHAVWADSRAKFIAVADALDRAGAPTTDRVMSIDASGTKYWTGRGGVVLVNDPIETVERVARAYDTRWLVLDGEDSVTITQYDPEPTIQGSPA